MDTQGLTEHEAFRKAVRAWVQKELTPHALEWDRAGIFPKEVFKQAGELGFLGMNHDPKYGGSGLDYWTEVTPLRMTFRILNRRPDLPLYFNFQVYNQDGVCVFNTASPRQTYPSGLVEGTCLVVKK